MPKDIDEDRGGSTILLVEDEATIRSFMSEALADEGFDVLEAATGAEAVAILRSDVPIDLLVTDVGLPGGVNGRQVAEAGRTTRSALRILFVTGDAGQAGGEPDRPDAGMAILTKPFTMALFTQRVAEAVSG